MEITEKMLPIAMICLWCHFLGYCRVTKSLPKVFWCAT